jgi:hypothetical protein
VISFPPYLRLSSYSKCHFLAKPAVLHTSLEMPLEIVCLSILLFSLHLSSSSAVVFLATLFARCDAVAYWSSKSCSLLTLSRFFKKFIIDFQTSIISLLTLPKVFKTSIVSLLTRTIFLRYLSSLFTLLLFHQVF